MVDNVITVSIGNSRKITTRPAWLTDKGMILRFVGVELPNYYVVDFARSLTEQALPVIGTPEGVAIPSELFHNSDKIFAWLRLTQGDNVHYTVYQITIPLQQRSEISNVQPTPEQEDIIDQAITALNVAMSATSADAAAANTNALKAEGYAVGQQNGTDVESGSPYYENNAKYYAEEAEASAASIDPETLAKIDGSYSSLTAGNAEQLVSTVGIEDNVPYNFRTAGGSSDIGDRETDMVVGGTVAWNQNLKEVNSTNWVKSTVSTSVSITGGVATVTAGSQYAGLINGTVNRPTFPTAHKMLYSVGIKLTTAVANAIRVKINNQDQKYAAASTTWQTISGFFTWDSTKAATFQILDFRASDRDAYQVKEPMLTDLTAMFGSTIADYIYALEQSNAGAGVAYFKKLFPKPYYQYNSGEFLSVQTSAHRTIGFNQWDEEWEVGGINSSTGANVVGTNTIRAKNNIRIIPNTVYHYKCSAAAAVRYYDASGNYLASYAAEIIANSNFTTPSDAAFMRFVVFAAYGTTYNHDICINLHLDGEKDGTYEPYELNSYALDSSLTLRGIPKLDSDNKLYYDGDTYESDGTVTRKYGERSYTSGDESLADAITDGTTTVYKLATPTTETAEPYQNPQIVNDFGTEEYVDAGVTASTPTRDVAIPVGHQTFYQANLRAKLEMAPDSPSGDGDYIVRQSDGENTYVPLVIPTELPTNPSTDGTYFLKVTVSDGTATLSWVADA